MNEDKQIRVEETMAHGQVRVRIQKTFEGYVHDNFDIGWISLDPEEKDACLSLKRGLFHKKKWPGMKKVTIIYIDEDNYETTQQETPEQG